MPRDWWREYRYRKAFGGLTHEQYLDESAVAVDWLLKIDDAVRDAEAESRQPQSRRPDASGVVTRPL